MRGQRLFTRPIDASDSDGVRDFLSAQNSDASVPACGLLGKLVGELVAVAAMSITPDAIEIERIVVARDLRRKRIGRVMLDEIERIAAKMERMTLVVNDAADADEFFRRVGFEREGARWIRHVRREGAQHVSRQRH